jgi:phage terminase small subunit
MSPKQRAFVSEYVIDSNGSAAAIRAGYSVATAKQQASQMLALPEVAAAIAAEKAALAEKNAVTADWIIGELRAVAVSKAKGDAVRALELLGKHLGLFKERIEHSGPNGGAIPGQFEIRFVRPARDDEPD